MIAYVLSPDAHHLRNATKNFIQFLLLYHSILLSALSVVDGKMTQQVERIRLRQLKKAKLF